MIYFGMKKKNKKPFMEMDERNRQIAGKVIAVMYFLTIVSMQGILLYRRFVLGQNLSDFEDIAIIVTINTLFLVSALLYFGAIPLQKLKVKSMILIYAALVVLGSLFTWFKYNIIQKQGLSIEQLFDKVMIVMAIIGLIMGFWILLSIVGKKRIDKDLEE